jgi:hypothetical protein
MKKKKHALRSAPNKQRIIISLIGWLIELIIEAIKSRKKDTALKKAL